MEATQQSLREKARGAVIVIDGNATISGHAHSVFVIDGTVIINGGTIDELTVIDGTIDARDGSVLKRKGRRKAERGTGR